jgi:hypothetical protein
MSWFIGDLLNLQLLEYNPPFVESLDFLGVFLTIRGVIDLEGEPMGVLLDFIFKEYRE